MLHFIIQQSKLFGRKVTKKEVLKLLQNAEDGEFLDVRETGQIFRQICA